MRTLVTPLYDAHNHFQDDWLLPYRKDCLTALTEIGLGRAVVNGTAESDWPAVSDLAREFSWVVPSYGLHPWFIGERTTGWLEALDRQLEEGGMVGEIGLDRWKEPFDFADQQRVFRAQLQLAVRRQRPVTIHCLKAWGGLMEILREEVRPGTGLLLHAYSGPAELVGELVELGAYFSFSGYFLQERKRDRREVFRTVPEKRLLVETDAPAMPLPRERELYPLAAAEDGRQINHPGNLLAVYQGLAALRGLPTETLAEIVAHNFHRLFLAGSAAPVLD